MTTPVFPTTIPGVSQFSWVPTPQLLFSDFERSPQARRRRTRRPGAVAQVSWNFLEGDYAIFREFWKTDLIRGHRWFWLDLPCANGIKPHKVRFITHATAPKNGFNQRTVNAQLEVLERKIRSEITDLYYTTLPYPLFVSESLTASFSTQLLQLNQALQVLDELDLSFSTISLEMEDLLAHAYGDDELESSFETLSLSMPLILKTAEAGIEELETSFSTLSLVLDHQLIRVDYDTESLESSFSTLLLTLT